MEIKRLGNLQISFFFLETILKFNSTRNAWFQLMLYNKPKIVESKSISYSTIPLRLVKN